MPQLSISLLGSFQVTQDGQAITSFETDLARALLSYLSMHAGTSFSRETLAALFWPDSPADEALHALRQTLNRLRAAIGDHDAENDYLLVSRRTLAFNSQSDFWLDVTAFNDLLASTRQHAHRRLETCRSCNQQLLQANHLWRSDFLDTLNVNSSPFQEWLTINRERLRIQAIETFTHLANYYEQYGDEELARFFAWRQLELEPWREEAHRQLMRLMAANGQRSTALTQYRNCQGILTKEFGIEPAAETAALYEQIRTDKIVTPKTLLTNLPVYLSAFVGRERELRQITEYLQQRDCRLLTLVGLGGMGKTRLAIQVAMQEAAGYRDGVVFVPLSALHSANQVLTALAQALRFAISPQQDLSVQLRNYLKQKELLIILDSFEHVLDAARQISDLLKQAPNVQVLVTSRERLHVQGEWVYDIGGLGIPQNGNTEVIDDSAVQLFTQVAQRVQPQFNGDLPTIKQICQLLDGMPLAIEMAASWRRVLSCAEIVQEIEQDLGFLYAEMRDMPEHHRSLDAVFSSSWAMLTSDERDVLCRLSVFRGGFGRAAATDIAGAHARQLAALTDKSWLRQEKHSVEQSLRYGLHDLVQRYTAEQLAKQPDLEMLVHDRHSHYYATRLRQYLPILKGSKQKTALEEIAIDIENIRAAWNWAVNRRLVSDLEMAWESLFLFCDLQGWYQVGADACKQLALAFDLNGEVGERVMTGLGLACQGHFDSKLGHVQLARELLDQSIIVLQTTDAHYELALSLCHQAVILMNLGLANQAQGLFTMSLSYFQELGDPDRMATVLNYLGHVSYRLGDTSSALRYCQTSLALARSYQLRQREAESLHSLGDTCIHLSRVNEARGYYKQSLDCYREINALLGLSDTFVDLALCSLIQDQLTDAGYYLDQALPIKRQIGDRPGEALALVKSGHLAWRLNDYELAQSRYLDALEIVQKTGDQRTEGEIFMALGILAFTLGNGKNFWVDIKKALNIFKTIGDKVAYADGFVETGWIILRSGDFSTAEEYLRQSLTDCTEIGYKSGMARAFAGLGQLFYYLEAHEKAREYEQQALRLAIEIGARNIQANVLVLSGDTLGKLRRWREAAESYQYVLDIYPKSGRSQNTIEPLAGLADIAFVKGNLPDAQRYVEDVLSGLATVTPDGIRDPVRVCLVCYRVLKVDQDRRADEILATGYHYLQKRVKNVISEPLRSSYLQNIPSHRELLAEWAAVQG
ncbi:MAG: tetratricopeptide repeat protein [Chloroflexota bacterium]